MQQSADLTDARQVTRLNTEAGQLLMKGRAELALVKAEAAIAMDPKSDWAHYHRAAALAEMRKLDDAEKAYQKAVSLFPSEDAWGRSLAMWGRAQALRQAGRCDEAKSAFSDYIAKVSSRDTRAAEQAREQADACKTAGERALDREPPPSGLGGPTAVQQPAATTPPLRGDAVLPAASPSASPAASPAATGSGQSAESRALPAAEVRAPAATPPAIERRVRTPGSLDN